MQNLELLVALARLLGSLLNRFRRIRPKSLHDVARRQPERAVDGVDDARVILDEVGFAQVNVAVTQPALLLGRVDVERAVAVRAKAQVDLLTVADEVRDRAIAIACLLYTSDAADE